MVRRLPLVLGAVLATLLLTGVANAQGCSEVSISPDEYTKFLQEVYSPTGLLTLKNMKSVESLPVSRMNKESIAVVDPEKGVYYTTEFNSTAADLERAKDFFMDDKVVIGPFYIVGRLNDTLRVSYDTSMGYAYDKGLNERFEGRLEFGAEEGLENIRSEIDMLFNGLKNRIGKGERVKNVLRAKDFTVTTTCAASGCQQSMYSLFTKYMNIGASAQMIVEFVGGAFYEHFVPGSVKKRVRGSVERFKATITGHKSVTDVVLDDVVKNMDDTTKNLIKGDIALENGEVKKIGGGILDDSFSVSRFKHLPPSQKQSLELYSALLEEQSKKVFQQADVCKSTGKCDDFVSALKDWAKALDATGSSVESMTKYVDDLERLVKLNPDSLADDLTRAFQKGAKKSEVREYLIEKGIPSSVVDSILEGGGYGDVINPNEFKAIAKDLSAVRDRTLKSFAEEVEPLAQRAARNSRLLAEEIAGDVPIANTLARGIKDAYREQGGYLGRTVVGEYTLAPLTYYMVKKLAVGRQENPFATSGAYRTKVFPAVLATPYPLPDTWKIGEISPVPDYSDAFVDILIGHGSDPGDAFKTVLSFTGFPLFVQAVESTTGRSIPDFGVLVTKEASRLNQMGPAVIAFGTSTEDCPSGSCVLSIDKTRLTFSGSYSVPALGSVTEDTNTDREGSTIILFGHHVRFLFEDYTLDPSEAEKEGRSCRQSCRLVNLPVLKNTSPGTAMFIASYAQSLSYVLGGMPALLLFGVGGYSYVLAGCSDCVDVEGGYYLHMRVPPKNPEEGEILENPATENLTKVLEGAEKVIGGFSDELKEKIEAFKKKVVAESIRNKSAYVQIDVDGLRFAELRVTHLAVLDLKADTVVEASYSQDGSIAGDSYDGRSVIVDREKGKFAIDGKTIISEPELARLAYIDNTIPGIVIPTRVKETFLTGTPAIIIKDREHYDVVDTEFLQCFASLFPDGEASTEFFSSVMGRVVYVKTSRGGVSFADNKMVAATEDWSRLASAVFVYGIDGNYSVVAKTAVVDVNQEGNVMAVSAGTIDSPMGSLESIIFENGAIYRRGNSVLIHVRRMASVSGKYVDSVALGPEENGMSLKLVPKPDAPADVKAQVERINKLVEEMGGINAIVAENGAVAIFRDENGVLWYREFDTNAMREISIEALENILRSALEGATTFETLDRSLFVGKKDNSVVLVYLNRASGEYVSEVVQDYSVDENSFVVVTDAGEHRIEFRDVDGVVHVFFDGVDYGLPYVPGAVREERVLNMYADPQNPGRLIVETEDGKHSIEVKVDQNGNPLLVIDDIIKGLVKFMQGPKGLVAYDPASGTWSFISGLLTPLADAFKNGIHISIDSNGNSMAVPRSWDYVASPYSDSSARGMNLPLFEGPEVVLLTIALALVFALIR